MAGAQRYKCKHCGFQFTRSTPHGKPLRAKVLALLLYLSGLSMTMIGNILGVSTQSIMRWIRLLSEKLSTSERKTQLKEIDTDELTSYITQKKLLSGSEKVLLITLENVSAGNVLIVVPKP